MGQERRIKKRRHLIYYLKVFQKGTKQIFGYVADITTEGMLLFSPRRIRLNAIYNLRIKLPTEEDIFCEAKSIWGEKDANPDFFLTGFQFKKISPKDLKSIRHLIGRSSFRE